MKKIEEVEVVDIEETGKFLDLNFMIETNEWVSYEFKGAEIIIEGYGEQSLFRMFLYKETDEITVHSAYSQDYDVMEEVTWYFDIEKLHEDIEEFITKNGVEDISEIYKRYCELKEKGYSDEEACYEANIEVYNE
ncbi:hypothetical protein [Cytobacillus sp. IB215665]|uniref:hypothetical protein n=1 Tax=Cytobacillus sp. IB215665 TaxID=3097357 RepID=UPI002A0D8C07|nr:hypothetical protein [Cytobacillus sp. IB215665]MDX8367701.1 hypothetical protein [Cytobacillus sp. IB215665]